MPVLPKCASARQRQRQRSEIAVVAVRASESSPYQTVYSDGSTASISPSNEIIFHHSTGKNFVISPGKLLVCFHYYLMYFEG